MDNMLQLKDKKKKKSHLYAPYKRHISDLKTHDWKWKDGKAFIMQMEVERKLG